MLHQTKLTKSYPCFPCWLSQPTFKYSIFILQSLPAWSVDPISHHYPLQGVQLCVLVRPRIENDWGYIDVGSMEVLDLAGVAFLLEFFVGVVELLVLEPEVANGPGGLEPLLHVAGATLLADDDVFVLGVLFLEPGLFLLGVGVEHAVELLEAVVGVDKDSLAVAEVGGVDLVVGDDGCQGTGSDPGHRGQAEVVGHECDLIKLLLDLVVGLLDGLQNEVVAGELGVVVSERLVNEGMQSLGGVLGELPSAVAVENGDHVAADGVELGGLVPVLDGVVGGVLEGGVAVVDLVLVEVEVTAEGVLGVVAVQEHGRDEEQSAGKGGGDRVCKKVDSSEVEFHLLMLINALLGLLVLMTLKPLVGLVYLKLKLGKEAVLWFFPLIGYRFYEYWHGEDGEREAREAREARVILTNWGLREMVVLNEEQDVRGILSLRRSKTHLSDPRVFGLGLYYNQDPEQREFLEMHGHEMDVAQISKVVRKHVGELGEKIAQEKVEAMVGECILRHAFSGAFGKMTLNKNHAAAEMYSHLKALARYEQGYWMRIKHALFGEQAWEVLQTDYQKQLELKSDQINTLLSFIILDRFKELHAEHKYSLHHRYSQGRRLHPVLLQPGRVLPPDPPRPRQGRSHQARRPAPRIAHPHSLLLRSRQDHQAHPPLAPPPEALQIRPRPAPDRSASQPPPFLLQIRRTPRSSPRPLRPPQSIPPRNHPLQPPGRVRGQGGHPPNAHQRRDPQEGLLRQGRVRTQFPPQHPLQAGRPVPPRTLAPAPSTPRHPPLRKLLRQQPSARHQPSRPH